MLQLGAGPSNRAEKMLDKTNNRMYALDVGGQDGEARPEAVMSMKMNVALGISLLMAVALFGGALGLIVTQA
jgi:hypothetical protein